MTKKYIDAEAFRRKLIDEKSFFPSIVARALEEMTAADVEEVKHGFWKKEKLVMCEPYYLCSICGKMHDQEYLYCNECGAKMDYTPKERGEEK